MVVAFLVSLGVLVAVAAAYLVHRHTSTPARGAGGDPSVDLTERHTQPDSLTQRENELIERRVELDARRGPLLGDDSIEQEFVRLEEKLRTGEIDEAAFEREKLRLLGG